MTGLCLPSTLFNHCLSSVAGLDLACCTLPPCTTPEPLLPLHAYRTTDLNLIRIASNMTTAVAIQPAMPRSTPVPIAAARPKKQQNPSPVKENHIPGKPVSSNTGPVANIRTRRERPCDACRRRKSRCVIHEGAVLCVLCEFHKQECTFVQSPLPRKRKVVDGEKKDSPTAGKKRYVELFFSHTRHLPKWSWNRMASS